MRIRTIKPEFWRHPILARLADGCRLLAIGVLTAADDEGYFLADPILLRNDLFPFRSDSGEIPEWLRILINVSYIEVCDNKEMGPIGRVVQFSKHQRISHPTPSKLRVYWNSGNSPEILRVPPEILRPDQGTGNREQGTGKGSGEGCSEPVASLPGSSEDFELDETPDDTDESNTYAQSPELIYEAYPLHKGRDKAIRAIRKVLASKSLRVEAGDDDPSLFLKGRVELFALYVEKNRHMFYKTVAGREDCYIPHPATWFNQGRWADQDFLEWEKTL